MESKYLWFEPKFLAITESAVIAASDDVVYAWNFKAALMSKVRGRIFISRDHVLIPSLSLLKGNQQKVKMKGGFERIFSINVPGSLVSGSQPKFEWRWAVRDELRDNICAITAGSGALFVGRDSGVVLRFKLPSMAPDGKYQLPEK